MCRPLFDVVFSTFSLVAANNTRDPNSPIALGDEIVFHDQLLANGKQVGDSLGSCVVAALSPDILTNCTAVFRVPGGNITPQFPNVPGPAPKDLALTGGTGTYRSAGGDGTLVEFGNGRGSLTLRVLTFVARGGRGSRHVRAAASLLPAEAKPDAPSLADTISSNRWPHWVNCRRRWR
jgi:allene oxide cyclase-like protein